MICDTLEHLGRYKGLHPNLDIAIDYLLTHDLSALPDGRTEVDGGEVFTPSAKVTVRGDGNRFSQRDL